jgi:hypothetical protein
MIKSKVFVSPLERKTIKEIVALIKKHHPGVTQEAIAESIGYDRTALSKKDVKGEAHIKALLIFRYLQTETSSSARAKKDVNNSDDAVASSALMDFRLENIEIKVETIFRLMPDVLVASGAKTFGEALDKVHSVVSDVAKELEDTYTGREGK